MPESTARRPPTKRESDLHVIPPRGSVPAILSEHKIWDLDASLFDVAKLLTFARLDGVASTYLVAGERRELFDTHKPGRALYARTDRSWHITELCHGPWKDTWMKHLLNAGVARPRCRSTSRRLSLLRLRWRDSRTTIYGASAWKPNRIPTWSSSGTAECSESTRLKRRTNDPREPLGRLPSRRRAKASDRPRFRLAR